MGIGAMTDERWSDFYNKMVKAGVVKAGIDYKKAYTAPVRQQGRRPRFAAKELIARARDAPPPRSFLRRRQRVVDVGRQHGGDR